MMLAGGTSGIRHKGLKVSPYKQLLFHMLVHLNLHNKLRIPLGLIPLITLVALMSLAGSIKPYVVIVCKIWLWPSGACGLAVSLCKAKRLFSPSHDSRVTATCREYCVYFQNPDSA